MFDGSIILVMNETYAVVDQTAACFRSRKAHIALKHTRAGALRREVFTIVKQALQQMGREVLT